jgi:hypothetical protein
VSSVATLLPDLSARPPLSTSHRPYFMLGLLRHTKTSSLCAKSRSYPPPNRCPFQTPTKLAAPQPFLFQPRARPTLTTSELSRWSTSRSAAVASPAVTKGWG